MLQESIESTLVIANKQLEEAKEIGSNKLIARILHEIQNLNFQLLILRKI